MISMKDFGNIPPSKIKFFKPSIRRLVNWINNRGKRSKPAQKSYWKKEAATKQAAKVKPKAYKKKVVYEAIPHPKTQSPSLQPSPSKPRLQPKQTCSTP